MIIQSVFSTDNSFFSIIPADIPVKFQSGKVYITTRMVQVQGNCGIPYLAAFNAHTLQPFSKFTVFSSVA